MSGQKREPRQLNSRETESRQKQWQPASLLPDPTPVDGVAFRWIRKSTLGNFDPSNFSRSRREGWEPCKLEDHPEMVGLTDSDSAASGLIEIGGLVLCKMPQEFVDQRAAHFNRQTQAQMTAVDNNLMRENDSRMPLFNERKSKVTFGNGS